MISILIVGKGNVGTHLFEALKPFNELKVSIISSRNLTIIPIADLTILAVSDDAIQEVSHKINNTFVVHTSGSVAMSQLKNTSRKGVFYMLQSFSKEKKVDFSKIPFCLEVQHSLDFEMLSSIAKLLSEKIYQIDSEQRKIVHVAAVFANNFTNHLYKIANDICDKNQIPFEILYPLIAETAEKITTLPPILAQTGPAVRKDSETIKNHLFLLNEKQQEIYKILTNSIQNDA